MPELKISTGPSRKRGHVEVEIELSYSKGNRVTITTDISREESETFAKLFEHGALASDDNRRSFPFGISDDR